MRILLPVFLFFFGFLSLNAQESPSELHPIVSLAKETSLYTDRVNWEIVNAEFQELAQGKSDAEELKEALQYLINSLGDKHAQVRRAADFSALVWYTGKVELSPGPERDPEFQNSVINDVTATFSYLLMEDGVGYLKVVGIGPGDVKAQADAIRKGLVDLDAKGVDKWILDLRYNGGGNMEPMIAGLAPLIGEGFIGGAINSRDEIRTFEIKAGQFYNYERLVCEMKDTPEIDESEPVVVLLSRYTVSSGELLAVSLKGRANTHFLGEESGGYTTGNGFDQITDELILMISQDVFIDRNNNRYDGRVGVDEPMVFEHQTRLIGDAQVERAVEWLLQNAKK